MSIPGLLMLINCLPQPKGLPSQRSHTTEETCFVAHTLTLSLPEKPFLRMTKPRKERSKRSDGNNNCAGNTKTITQEPRMVAEDPHVAEGARIVQNKLGAFPCMQSAALWPHARNKDPTSGAVTEGGHDA